MAKKLTIDIEFDIGDMVYNKTDSDQEPGMVIGFSIRPNRLLVYDVQKGDNIRSYYDFEISGEVNVLSKV